MLETTDFWKQKQELESKMRGTKEPIKQEQKVENPLTKRLESVIKELSSILEEVKKNAGLTRDTKENAGTDNTKPTENK